MKKLINCDRATFTQALNRQPTQEEAKHLKEAALALGFRHLKDGRQISPRTWLTIARADQRGKLATPGVRCCGHMVAAALAVQHIIVASIRRHCPDLMGGMLVEAEEREQTQALEVQTTEMPADAFLTPPR